MWFTNTLLIFVSYKRGIFLTTTKIKRMKTFDHIKFGKTTVIEVSKDTVTVNTEKAGEKKLLRTFVEKFTGKLKETKSSDVKVTYNGDYFTIEAKDGKVTGKLVNNSGFKKYETIAYINSTDFSDNKTVSLAQFNLANKPTVQL